MWGPRIDIATGTAHGRRNCANRRRLPNRTGLTSNDYTRAHMSNRTMQFPLPSDHFDRRTRLIDKIRRHSMEESDAILASGIYLKKTNNSHMIYFETIKPDGTMRKNTINCATAAVIAWQRMGAKGQWGVRKGKLAKGKGFGVLEICKAESEEWWKWKMIEEINRRGVMRLVGIVDGIEYKDEISLAMRKYCPTNNAKMLRELGEVMREVDKLVKKKSNAVKRVVLHGRTMQEMYLDRVGTRSSKVIEGGEVQECEIPKTGEIIVKDANCIGVVHLLDILGNLTDGGNSLCLLIDTLAAPRPGQLGAPLLDYERLSCGWGSESVLEQYGACPAHLRAISSGHVPVAGGIEFHSPEGLLALPPLAGGRVMSITHGWGVDNIFGPHVARLKLIEQWSPTTNVTNEFVGAAACIVFATTRLYRSTLYRLRAACDLVIVIIADDKLHGVLQGSHWDTTWARMHGPRRAIVSRSTISTPICLPKPNKRKHSMK